MEPKKPASRARRPPASKPAPPRGRTAKQLTVLAETQRELKANNAAKASPALAALALKLAETIDERPSALMARELREALKQLAELAPPKAEEDELDRLRSRRDARLARRAAPSA